MKYGSIKEDLSAEEALDKVFKLLENDTVDTLQDDENGDLEELGQVMDFEKRWNGLTWMRKLTSLKRKVNGISQCS